MYIIFGVQILGAVYTRGGKRYKYDQQAFEAELQKQLSASRNVEKR